MEAKQKAQSGLSTIMDAIVDLLRGNQSGLTNGEVTNKLGLESDQGGKQKNYLAWSILGLLMKQGRVVREENRYRLK